MNNMEELIFQKLQKGDVIFSLERDRRSGYPIFDQAKVLRIGESKPRAIQGKDNFIASTEIQLQDSVSSLTVYLPSNEMEGIYNGIYYTTNLGNIVNELQLQRQQALTILNNRDKYEAVVKECESILERIGNSKPSQPQAASQEFEEFKSIVSKRMDDQESLLIKIAKELGLGENKPN